MKPNLLSLFFAFRLLTRPALIFALLGWTATAAAEEVALIIPVEAGMRLIRVEARDAETGEWRTVALAHLEGQAGEVKVRIPAGLDPADLRITESSEAMLPESLIRRRDSVRTHPLSEEEALLRGGSSFLPVDRWLDFDLVDGDTGSAPPEEWEGNDNPDEVVESDIWRIHGDRLYFYNQKRGLQVYDLSVRSAPVRLGSYSYPGRGEQMYLLGADHVLLLGAAPDFEVVVLEITASGQPVLVERLPGLPGNVIESRLVGSRLYYATQSYGQPNSGSTGYRHALHVGGFDFADPATPQTLDALTFAADQSWGNVVTASPTHFLLSTVQDGSRWGTDWWPAHSEVYVIDLQGPGGHPQLVDTVSLGGVLSDKYKLALTDGVLTTIGQVQTIAQIGWSQHTLLETFTLGETGFTKAGELTLGEGDTLFATLIEGNRAYIVTFFIIDPLFVVDLSDPASPEILGELDVPGYSSFIRLLRGGQLFSVGVEDRRVAASLFSVENPDKLELLSRAYIGAEGEYTWTEANYDDRAISLLEDHGLVLLPFQQFGQNGNRTGIQIFSIDGDTITAHGQFFHDGQARRATALDAATVASISDRELLTVDLSDLEAPALLSETLLAWSADRIFVHGDHLIQVGTAPEGKSGTTEFIVTPKDDPDHLLAHFTLDSGHNLGLVQRGAQIYALQGHTASTDYVPYAEISRFSVAILDFTNPLAVVLSHQPEAAGPDVPTVSNYERFEGTWLDETTLLWNTTTEPVFPYYDDFFITPVDGFAQVDIAHCGIYYFPSLRPTFLSFELTTPTTAVYRDGLRYEADSDPYGNGSASAIRRVGETAFFSTRRSFFEAIPLPPADNGTVNIDYRYRDEQKLVAIDLSAPFALRFATSSPVNGELLGVEALAEGGVLLYTGDTRSRPVSHRSVGETYTRVFAYVYDGVQLLTVDEVEWPLAANDYFAFGSEIVMGQRVFYRPTGTSFNPQDPASIRLDRLQFNAENRFEAASSWELEGTGFYAFGVSGDTLLALTNARSQLWELSTETVAEIFAPIFPAPGTFGPGRVVYEPGEYLLLAHQAYGVHRSDLTPFPAPALSSPNGDFRPRAETGFSQLIAPARTTLTTVNAADAVGRLVQRRWLFRPAALLDPDPSATDHADGWQLSTWFGWYQRAESLSWIYHLEHGWTYSHRVEGGTWLHDTSLGWAWTQEDSYPFVYSVTRGSWLYYLKGTGLDGTRWFFDHHPDVQDWVGIERR